MTVSHPMEQVFIGEIEKIVASTFRREHDFDEYLKKLEQHYTKALKMGWVNYQVTALNAIALLYSHYGEPEEGMAIKTLEEALHIIEQTNNIDLHSRILSNLCFMNFTIGYNVQSAEKYVNEGLKLVADAEKAPSSNLLFLISNKLRCLIWRGDFVAARMLMERAWHHLTNSNIPGIDRYSYARIVFFIRQQHIQLYLAEKNCEKAQDAIRINQELYEDVYQTDDVSSYSLHMALYDLICDRNPDSFTRHLADVQGNQEHFSVVDCLRYTLYLKHLAYIPQAQEMLNKALQIIEMPIFILNKNDAFEQYIQVLRAELNTGH